ncbi:YceI family protein [Robiginitalea sp. M366]|uniref:YceI family protein n=1 Tax=Robiginitalea aestuariiviva TaxID=3036903 RepID=UPI00240E59BC|nr:YceI family protein [Robiginitalea aestuariiviva]MDG1570718.1 YceI family protein [Robiginitalea aestuariiviva]
MKKQIITLALALMAGGAALATEPAVEKKEVNTEKSTVTWKAYKVTGSHTGTVALKSGSLMFEDGQLSGGEFAVDMTSLTATDLEGEWRDKLVGHLKSDDFFSTASHPESTLVFTSIKANGKNSYEVTGDLTIKGITKPVTFDLSVYGSKATATMKIDRAEYDVRYGSGSFFDDLGDKTIYDEFDLVVDLEWDTAS